MFWRFYWAFRCTYLPKPIKLHWSRSAISGLCEPRPTFPWPPQPISSSRLADSSCLCFCFTSGPGSICDSILACALPMYYSPPEAMGVWLWGWQCVICIEMGVCFLSGRQRRTFCLSLCVHTQLKQYFVHIKRKTALERETGHCCFCFDLWLRRVLVEYGSVYLRLRESLKLFIV